MSDLTVRNIRPHAGGNRIRKSRADRIFDIVIYTVAVLLTNSDDLEGVECGAK